MRDITRFGTDAGTYMPVAAAIAIAIAIIAVLGVQRRNVLVPFLFAALVIPMAPRITVAGFNMHSARILLLFAWVRVLADSKPVKLRLNSIDKWYIAWGIGSLVTFTLLWGDFAALANRVGLLYNGFGTYFLVRIVCERYEGRDRTVVVALLAAVSVISLGMLLDHVVGHNFFAYLGGVPEHGEIREGRLRAQGPMGHAILAGVLGAVLLPVALGQWWGKGAWRKPLVFVAIAACLLAVLASASSTPLMVLAAVVVGLCWWPLRNWMRALRWTAVALVIALHLLMKAPVWALIARVDVVGGNSAYHRFELVNGAIVHFADWWLLGVKTTANWGSGWFTFDTANQYVDTAVTGGLATLVCFLAVISLCFSRIGKAWRLAPPADAKRYWCVGVFLFANCVAFVGVAYFDQTSIMWYAVLGLIASISLQRLRTQPQPLPVETGDAQEFAAVTL